MSLTTLNDRTNTPAFQNYVHTFFSLCTHQVVEMCTYRSGCERCRSRGGVSVDFSERRRSQQGSHPLCTSRHSNRCGLPHSCNHEIRKGGFVYQRVSYSCLFTFSGQLFRQGRLSPTVVHDKHRVRLAILGQVVFHAIGHGALADTSTLWHILSSTTQSNLSNSIICQVCPPCGT